MTIYLLFFDTVVIPTGIDKKLTEQEIKSSSKGINKVLINQVCEEE